MEKRTPYIISFFLLLAIIFLSACAKDENTPFTCLPKTCIELGKNCGIIEDNCGNTLDCGACSSENQMDRIENAIKNKLK